MTFRDKLRTIIFEAETKAGRRFDIALLWLIIGSTLLVILDSVDIIHLRYEREIYAIEWLITILFSIEYLARLYTSQKPLKYVTSFYGIVDLLSILPTFLGLILQGSPSFLVVRTLRLLRAFRVLKLVHFVGEADVLMEALNNSRRKIIVFIWCVISIVVIVGSLMYLVEGDEGGFTSIPTSIYWAIVTLTTVGYGDVTPVTIPGKMLASVVMILGYGIIAVPTGIVSSEISMATYNRVANTITCPRCFLEGHHPTAKFCRQCGHSLSTDETPTP